MAQAMQSIRQTIFENSTGEIDSELRVRTMSQQHTHTVELDIEVLTTDPGAYGTSSGSSSQDSLFHDERSI